MSETSSINFHYWSLKTDEELKQSSDEKLPNINFHVLKYSDKCLYVWIGDFNNKIENLSCAIKTPYEKDPTGVEIMLANEELNNNTNSLGKDLSIKLSRKLNKQVFVSFNVACDLLEKMIDNTGDGLSLMQLIEKRLFTEIKQHPELF
ncbi:unnamed protein product [Brachionus calyciflorus]|uniref:Proteasome assembly chaperone 4 n=1 Tax=Brachionus calyciflorus TaxID=104777 RepID=A0A814RPA2_9BILA|nr:unnamed protein product [Brachionus calyciflorus]